MSWCIHPLDLVYLTVLSRFLFWRPSVCPRLGAAAETSTCQARSSKDSITIDETLGARLDPGRRRSNILIIKVIVALARCSAASVIGFRKRHNDQDYRYSTRPKTAYAVSAK
jgi:hypothetical protein